MPNNLDEFFERCYDDIFNTTEGELGEKITVLEENRQQLAQQLDANSIDDCPRLATEVYLGDEITREVAHRLFLCGVMMGLQVQAEVTIDDIKQDQKETPPKSK